MRIVAGKYKGRNLFSPADDRVRPTTTRIKETLFNVLQWNIKSSVVLDLFSGSGALGIECLSRGADEVYFVDKSRDSIALTRKNLEGIEGNAHVIQSDFLSALNVFRSKGQRFDLIFLDPPYASDLAERALDVIVEGDLLNKGGTIIFEHSSEKEYEMPYKMYICRTKRMGTVTAEFITKRTIALMTGSFDPITVGHEIVLMHAFALFDDVVVACLVNPDKDYMFTPKERLSFAKAVCAEYSGAHAMYSEKSAVEVAQDIGATEILRGIRNENDEKYETEMAEYNRSKGINTRFVRYNAYNNVSSTMVREQLKAGIYDNIPDAAKPLVMAAMMRRKGQK